MEDKYLKLSEEYLSGKMDPDQQKAFEKELETNQELRRAFDETQFAMETVDIQAEKDLRNQFEEWKGSEPDAEVRPIKVRSQRMIIGVAASVIIMLGAIILMIPTELNNQQLAEKYYKAPEIAGTTLGTDNENWQSGMNAYDSGNPAEAIQYWKQMNSPNEEASYFMGHAYWQNGDFSKAIELLQPLSKSNSNYATPAQWYLSLAYLANDQKEEFNRILETILQNPDHPFHRQAGQLQKEF